MRRELGMLVALLVLCGALWWSNPNFVGESNVFNTSRQISMLGILAIGSAFVIITGGIDLSVGSMVGLTGVILAKISSNAEGGMGEPLWIGIAVAMAIALLIGLAQGLLITRVNLQPFIVTLGGMLTLRGVSQTIVHGGNVSYSAFRDFANASILKINGDPVLPLLLLILFAVAVVSAYLLHFTVFGRYIYAIGGNRDAAEYSGIPVKNVETLTYVISAGLAGIAGICYASYIQQMDQNVGVAFELSAIAACVLGGCSLRGGEGAVVGVLIGTALMKVI
jgi:ribose transport system permease protein